MTIDSSVRDLLDGYLRDLITAHAGLTKALENHRAELGRDRYDDLERTIENISGEIGALACSECWSAADHGVPVPLGLYPIDQFTVVCDDCYDTLNAKREPFDGDCSRGF